MSFLKVCSGDKNEEG